MITFVCWKWNSDLYKHKYTAEHVNVWARSLKRNLGDGDFRFLCITDDPTGVEIETASLWGDHNDLLNPSGKHLPSCYRRLKLFDVETTRSLGVEDGDRVVWIDLDVVFVDDVRPMFKGRDADFVGWRGVGAYHDETYNGTIVMFRAGRVQDLWDDFDPETSPAIVAEKRYFGSDQGWLSYKMSGRADWWGTRDGMFSFNRDVRGSRRYVEAPRGARIVSFNGRSKPWDDMVRVKCPWVKEHWR